MWAMDYAPGQANVYGDRVLSLGDIIKDPDLSFWQMNANLSQNWQAMAIRSFTTGLIFRGAKKLLRRPISNVNRNIFRPLGMGFQL